MPNIKTREELVAEIRHVLNGRAAILSVDASNLEPAYAEDDDFGVSGPPWERPMSIMGGILHAAAALSNGVEILNERGGKRTRDSMRDDVAAKSLVLECEHAAELLSVVGKGMAACPPHLVPDPKLLTKLRRWLTRGFSLVTEDPWERRSPGLGIRPRPSVDLNAVAEWAVSARWFKEQLAGLFSVVPPPRKLPGRQRPAYAEGLADLLMSLPRSSREVIPENLPPKPDPSRVADECQRFLKAVSEWKQLWEGRADKAAVERAWGDVELAGGYVQNAIIAYHDLHLDGSVVFADHACQDLPLSQFLQGLDGHLDEAVDIVKDVRSAMNHLILYPNAGDTQAPPETVDTKGAAELLKVQEGSVSRLIREGKLKTQNGERGEGQRILVDSIKEYQQKRAGKRTRKVEAPKALAVAAKVSKEWQCRACGADGMFGIQPPAKCVNCSGGRGFEAVSAKRATRRK